MNAIERYAAVLNQKRPDKIPIRVANYNMFVCHYYGITIQEYLDDPALNAEVLVKFVREFGVDSVKAGAGYIFYGCGPEMGPTWRFIDGEFPVCVKGIIDEPENVGKVAIPAEPAGYFQKFLEINRRAKALIGHEVFLGVSALGPFSAMCFLRGHEKMLMDMLLDPAFFTELMKKGEDVSMFIGRHCLALDLPWINMLEVFLIPGMVNPDFYHSHIAPHDDVVCKQFAPIPMPNSSGAFMGRPEGQQKRGEGKLMYDYYFGNLESLEVIRSASNFVLSGYPRLVTVSARALANWPVDRILSFLKEGFDYFVKDRGEYPAINLASVQSANPEEAAIIAKKLSAMAQFRDTYTL